MKKVILLEILRALKSNPRKARKIKIFAGFAFVGLLLLTGLTIWTGVKAYNFVASQVHEAANSPRLQAEIGNLPRVQALNCWDKAQSLMAVRPWLEQTAIQNLINLRVACLENKPETCEGHECSKLKNLIHTAEGSTI